MFFRAWRHHVWWLTSTCEAFECDSGFYLLSDLTMSCPWPTKCATSSTNVLIPFKILPWRKIKNEFQLRAHRTLHNDTEVFDASDHIWQQTVSIEFPSGRAWKHKHWTWLLSEAFERFPFIHSWVLCFLRLLNVDVWIFCYDVEKWKNACNKQFFLYLMLWNLLVRFKSDWVSHTICSFLTFCRNS